MYSYMDRQFLLGAGRGVLGNGAERENSERLDEGKGGRRNSQFDGFSRGVNWKGRDIEKEGSHGGSYSSSKKRDIIKIGERPP